MFQLRTSLGQTMPVSVVLLTDGVRGNVAFIKTQVFNAIIIPEVEGVPSALFDMESFKIGEEDYQYNQAYDYKNIPSMLKWLVAQNLEYPHGMF